MESRKFRVWYQGNKMLYYLSPCIPDLENFMQYIGVEDKNGISIYESDVIKTTDINWGYGGPYDKDRDGYIYAVVPHIHEIVRGNVDSVFDNYYQDWWTGSEIIGNIHENPELKEKCRNWGLL